MNDASSVSPAACAVLGLLAYRAGCPFAARPSWLVTVAQLDAFQFGWSAGYDTHLLNTHQAYNLLNIRGHLQTKGK